MAAMTMQTVIFVAQNSGATDAATTHPITADEIWDFCSNGFAPQETRRDSDERGQQR
jgi:hypothetical protein